MTGPALVILRGLPACGKTTYARAKMAEDPTGWVRASRDDLRAMMHNGVHIAGVTEPRIVRIRDYIITDSLRRGLSVICDETNLDPRKVAELQQLARKYGARSEVVDMTGVPLELCIERNAARPDPVPEEWIREQYALHIAPASKGEADGGSQA
jgi:predicted kinase